MTAARRADTAVGVTGFRELLLRHRHLAGLLFALALAMKLAVPGGYMPMVVDGRIVVAWCAGVMPPPAETTMAMAAEKPMPMAGMAHGTVDHGEREDDAHHDQAPPVCPFATLAAPALAAVDAMLLAAAILFAMVRALRLPPLPLAAAAPRLRPPSRAPPFPA